MVAKLDLLIADPMRKVLEDPAFIAHISRQFARVFPGALAARTGCATSWGSERVGRDHPAA